MALSDDKIKKTRDKLDEIFSNFEDSIIDDPSPNRSARHFSLTDITVGSTSMDPNISLEASQELTDLKIELQSLKHSVDILKKQNNELVQESEKLYEKIKFYENERNKLIHNTEIAENEVKRLSNITSYQDDAKIFQLEQSLHTALKRRKKSAKVWRRHLNSYRKIKQSMKKSFTPEKSNPAFIIKNEKLNEMTDRLILKTKKYTRIRKLRTQAYNQLKSLLGFTRQQTYSQSKENAKLKSELDASAEIIAELKDQLHFLKEK